MHFYSQQRFSAFCGDDEDELSRSENNSTTTASLKSLSLSLYVCVCVYISPPLFVVLGNFHFIHIFQFGKKEYKESSSSFWFAMF